MNPNPEQTMNQTLDKNEPIASFPAKRPRGRPRRFDDQRREVLCTLISIGLSRRAAAESVGVPPSSVAHAARTDPQFAMRLRDAEIARAVRPPEFADIGRRGWHAAARLLEKNNPSDLAPPASKLDRWLASRRFKRAVRHIVHKMLERYLAEPSNAPDQPSPGTSASTADYCLTSRDFSEKPATQKQ
jgi:hypothetical protein